MKTPKYPAYGKQLAERIRWNNKPKLVIIEVGGNAWQRAKNWQRISEFAALVLTAEFEPSALKWPVKGCLCFVEWDSSVPQVLIENLVKSLKIAGASNVGVWPLFVDHNSPIYEFDRKTQKFVQIRECLKIYRGPMGANNVA
jgi:hypothetical protein